MDITIEKVKGFEVLDSRGNPTVCAAVALSDGTVASAMVPSGASTGIHEAVELRDNGARYFGKGVEKAVENIDKKIAKVIEGFSPFSQKEIDRKMIEADSSENKSKLGANAILAVSLAIAKAAAKSKGLPLYAYLGGAAAVSLPRPMMNILNGGAHAANNIDIQEFMVVPNIGSFHENLRAGAEIYNALKKLLSDKGLSTAVGDEGGFAPNLEDDSAALKLICDAILKAGYNTDNIKLALDVAASEWKTEDGYFLPKRKKEMDADELSDYIDALANEFPIISVEDPLGEDDFNGFREITERLGNKIMIVGDDLFVTNPARFMECSEIGIANAVLIKPNQIGTLSEVFDVIRMANRTGYSTIISHRSGDTEDSFIADLSVATNSPFIKTGAPCRAERTSKYNRLLMIEHDLS